MRFIPLPSLWLILAAGLWFAAVRVCAAQQEIKFPQKAPLVSFTLPAEWIGEDEKPGDFPERRFTSEMSHGMAISVLQETYSEADFKQKLPKYSKKWAAAFGFDENEPGSEVGPVTNRTLGDKIQAICCEVKFKIIGVQCRTTVYGFTVGGKSLLAVFHWDGTDEGFAAKADKVRNSFKALK